MSKVSYDLYTFFKGNVSAHLTDGNSFLFFKIIFCYIFLITENKVFLRK